MINKVSGQATYKATDLYREAASLLRSEVEGMKKEPLNSKEAAKMALLAKEISKVVLREMKIV